MPIDLADIARAWASIEGSVERFERGRIGADMDGTYEGYMIEAEELLKRSGLADHIKHLEQELARKDELLKLAQARNAMLEELLGRCPGAFNAAFSAGTEEREGGSARRQEKFSKGVDQLRKEIRAALSFIPKPTRVGALVQDVPKSEPKLNPSNVYGKPEADA